MSAHRLLCVSVLALVIALGSRAAAQDNALSLLGALRTVPYDSLYQVDPEPLPVRVTGWAPCHGHCPYCGSCLSAAPGYGCGDHWPQSPVDSVWRRAQLIELGQMIQEMEMDAEAPGDSLQETQRR